MKLNGFVGTGTGKLGSSVFSTVAGKQVVRQYQPVVANPSTAAQTNQRARLKLASQLAAALAPIIAIPRDGLKSSRNLFIKKNMDAITANGGTAQVTYENLQLTNGNVGLPAINIVRDAASGVTISLAESAGASVSRVVYCLYKKTSEQQLQFVSSKVCEVAGDDNTFPQVFDYLAGELVAFAYGMKDLSGKATAKYGDYSAQNGVDVAQLILSREINSSDFQLTQTRGNTLFAGENETVAPEEGKAIVYVSSSPAGANITSSVALTNGRAKVNVGSQITLEAPGDLYDGAYSFQGWYNNSTGQRITDEAEHTFTITENLDVQARYQIEAAGPSTGGEG